MTDEAIDLTVLIVTTGLAAQGEDSDLDRARQEAVEEYTRTPIPPPPLAPDAADMTLDISMRWTTTVLEWTNVVVEKQSLTMERISAVIGTLSALAQEAITDAASARDVTPEEWVAQWRSGRG